MFEIKLTPGEASMLHKILESYLSDLRVEIASTDLQNYREALKNEQVFIKEFLQRLEYQPAHARLERIDDDVHS
jgi:hypothetical protein